MRVSGWLLVVAMTAACSGTQQSAAPAPAPVGSEVPTGAATGTSGENPTGLSKPSIGSPEAAHATTVALTNFQNRVNAYAVLHKQLARGSAKQRETSDPARITQASDALAGKVQSARVEAKQGDMFTPDVRPIFRRLLAPELKGPDGDDTRAILEDDAPPPSAIPFKVNAKYPDAQPLPTVPAGVLATLPTLPEPLEYRIVGRHLILLDTASDIIVDYLPNAMPK